MEEEENITYLLSDMNNELGSTTDVMSSDIVRIPFIINDESQCRHIDNSERDDDVIRRKKVRKVGRAKNITIAHDGGTPLELVGRQIWRGCLFLSDFILWKRSEWTEGKFIELGGGVGICGVTLDMILNDAGWCYVTDYDNGALHLTARNLLANSHLALAANKAGTDQECVHTYTRRYNWNSTCLLSQSSNLEGTRLFNWQEEDIERMKGVEYIVCADCVYDEGLTNMLFDTIRHIMSKYNRKAVCYLALEKRFNFELSSLSVQAHGYRCFLRRLGLITAEGEQSPSPNKESDITLRGSQIPASFPQYFHYNRTPQLEMWRIWAKE